MNEDDAYSRVMQNRSSDETAVVNEGHRTLYKHRLKVDWPSETSPTGTMSHPYVRVFLPLVPTVSPHSRTVCFLSFHVSFLRHVVEKKSIRSD